MRWKSVGGAGLKFSVQFCLVWLASVEEVAAFATLAGRGCIINTQVKMYAYTYICLCAHICIYDICTYKCMYICMYLNYIYACIHTYIYVHVYIYI